MSELRERFEKWWLDKHPGSQFNDLKRSGEGYEKGWLDDCWDAWQKSAIEVAQTVQRLNASSQPAPSGASPILGEALIRKLAESWIETGLHGTGLRTDEYVTQHKEAIQGIYESCGKLLIEHLDYQPVASAGEPAAQTRGDIVWIRGVFDGFGPDGDEVRVLLHKRDDLHPDKPNHLYFVRRDTVASARATAAPASTPASRESLSSKAIKGLEANMNMDEIKRPLPRVVEHGIPRRNRIDLATPVEEAIRVALQRVEAMPADVRLTKATILLDEALDSVADYLEDVPAAPPATEREQWNDPHLQKIADDRDERFRQSDMRTRVMEILGRMKVQIDDPCLDRANDEYLPNSWVQGWYEELLAAAAQPTDKEAGK